MLLDKLALCVSLIMTTLGVTEGTKIRRFRKNAEEESTINVCNNEARLIMFCYCDRQMLNEATDGNCWVYNDTSLDEYKDIWENFASQNHIQHLTLHIRSDGTVDRIPTIAFMHLQEIQDFEVQYATISVIHSFAFANSSTLQDILLSRNGIKELEPSAFANMKKISKILLGENHLTEINRAVFVNLPKLANLYIEQNNITRIADYAFTELHSLEELELFSNQIKAIVPATFIGLEKLKRLELSHNYIEVIGDKTFQYLKSLKSLYLQENAIKFISQQGFYGLKKMQKLKLNDNKLISLEHTAFKHSPILSYLDISENVLETLEVDTFKPINKMLLQEGMVLVLKGNLLRCDTRLKWLFDLYNVTKSRNVIRSMDELHCYLEVGTLPPRFDATPTTNYEVTTLGIGPKVLIMKLQPEELPDPLLKTQAPFTEEDCEEELDKKPFKPKKKASGNHKKRKFNKKNSPAKKTMVEGRQNDMVSADEGSTEVDKKDLRPASPVHESRSDSSHSPKSVPNAQGMVTLQLLLVVLAFCN